MIERIFAIPGILRAAHELQVEVLRSKSTIHDIISRGVPCMQKDEVFGYDRLEKLAV
jgi:hypothetical protein